jgi:hypothetical protein
LSTGDGGVVGPRFFAFAVSGSGVLGVIFHPLGPMDAKVQNLGGKRFPCLASASLSLFFSDSRRCAHFYTF